MHISIKRRLWPIKVLIKNIYLFFKDREKLNKICSYKNKYSNQSCFVIGNGPSLNTSDLELISSYKTFASNSIFKIFSKTEWRPNFYAVCDKKYYEENKNSILENIHSPSFYPLDMNIPERKIDNFYLRQQKFFIEKKPPFSSNADLLLFDGSTVTYMLIQLAVYMGFKKIYLLGIDFSYSKVINIKGEIKINNTVKDYFNKDRSENNSVTPNLEQSYLSYKSALNHAKRNGIKIINLSRKTDLNLFDTQDLEEIMFSNK